MGHSKIKEFEDVLCSFSDMKNNLKSSLEKQWSAEQLQKEQIAALAHDLKTPLTVIQGNIDLFSRVTNRYCLLRFSFIFPDRAYSIALSKGDSDNSTISTHIKNIRAKLSKLDIQPIATVWGIGYKWE